MIHIIHPDKGSLRFSLHLRVYLFRVSVEHLRCSHFFFALAFGSSTLLVLKEPWNMFISSPPCYPGQGCSSPGLVESCPLHVRFSAQPMTQVDLLADVYRCFSLQPSFSLPNPKNSKLQVVPHCNLYLTQWDYCLHCGHLFSLLWFGKCPQN